MENEDSGEKKLGIFEQIQNYIVSESLFSGF